MKWRWLPLSTRNDDGGALCIVALDARAGGVADLHAGAGDHDGVAVLEIGDRVGERRQRDGVGAEIHLAVAVADRERRALARADQQVLLALEQERERERAAQPRQRRRHRVGRRAAVLHFAGDEMGDDLGVGLGAEFRAVLLELLAQLAEVLDDAVVHDRKPVGGMRMGVALGRPAVGRPAGVADADRALERLALELGFEIAKLALGAAARQAAAFQRGHAGGVIAAIFEALERIDQLHRDRLAAEDADNSAHRSEIPISTRPR